MCQHKTLVGGAGKSEVLGLESLPRREFDYIHKLLHWSVPRSKNKPILELSDDVQNNMSNENQSNLDSPTTPTPYPLEIPTKDTKLSTRIWLLRNQNKVTEGKKIKANKWHCPTLYLIQRVGLLHYAWKSKGKLGMYPLNHHNEWSFTLSTIWALDNSLFWKILRFHS